MKYQLKIWYNTAHGFMPREVYSIQQVLTEKNKNNQSHRYGNYYSGLFRSDRMLKPTSNNINRSFKKIHAINIFLLLDFFFFFSQF